MTDMMEMLAVGRTAPGSATWAHCGLPAARLPVMSSLAESVGLAETARQITTVAVRGAAARLQARASVGRCSTAGRRAWSTAPLRLTPAAAGPAGLAVRAQVIVTAAQVERAATAARVLAGWMGRATSSTAPSPRTGATAVRAARAVPPAQANIPVLPALME